MSKFIKKPVVVHAFKWDGKPSTLRKNVSYRDILKYFIVRDTPAGYKLQIRTLEGNMDCPVPDEIIRGVQGEYYACKQDIFQKTYRPVK